MMITIPFKLERETKGAVRFCEVDASEQPLDIAQAKVGTLYIRKTAFNGGAIPSKLTLTVAVR